MTLDVWEGSAKIFFAPYFEDVGSNVDRFSSKRDCARVIRLHQDGQGVQGELQLRAQPNKNTAYLKNKEIQNKSSIP